MKMIDKYIHDVTSRLSPAVQDDVALELKSSIGDMLPPDYTEEDVKEVLAEFGDPIKLASQYREHPSYSFGQQVYDFCSSSLKVTGFIFIVMIVVIAVTGVMTAITGEGGLFTLVMAISGDLIGAVLNIVAHVFFWSVLVLIFLERIGVNRDGNSSALTGKPWKPEDISNTLTTPWKKTISKASIYLSFFWTVFLTIAFFTFANGTSADEISLFNIPLLHAFLPFVVILAAAALALNLYKRKVGYWNKSLAVSNAVFHFAFVVFLIVFASRASLFNPAFMLYLSERFAIPVGLIELYQYIVLWTIVLSIISFVIYQAISGFKKARIKYF